VDTIFISDLKVKCVIGVWQWERQITQTVLLDLELASDVRVAAGSDKLQDTVNYKAVCARILDYAEGSSFQLIETLAENIATLILDEFAVDWCRVRLSKPGALRHAKAVGVILERGERQT